MNNIEKYYKLNLTLEEVKQIVSKSELITIKRKLLKDYGAKTRYNNIVSLNFNNGDLSKNLEFSSVELSKDIKTEAVKTNIEYEKADDGDPALYPNEWLEFQLQLFFIRKFEKDLLKEMKRRKL